MAHKHLFITPYVLDTAQLECMVELHGHGSLSDEE